MPKHCGAKTRGGQPCQTAGMTNGRCRMHGGTSLRGAASPRLTSGRYSKYLPTRLAGRYAEAMADPDLLQMRAEIVLIDTRLADVLGRVESGEAGGVWDELGKAWRRMIASARDGAISINETQEIASLIARGQADRAGWAEVLNLVQQRRKLVESERKRLVDMQQMISRERAMVMLAAVVDTVRRHVPDRAALAAISEDSGRLIEG